MSEKEIEKLNERLRLALVQFNKEVPEGEKVFEVHYNMLEEKIRLFQVSKDFEGE